MKKIYFIVVVILGFCHINTVWGQDIDCGGQCNNPWIQGSVPLAADTNGCGLNVYYKYRECVVNGQTIREVQITRLEEIPGGNCDYTSLEAKMAIAVKAVLFYSSGIFWGTNASIPYNVNLYTPGCWHRVVQGGSSFMEACNLPQCCTLIVKLQSVNGLIQAVDKQVIPSNINCGGVIGGDCQSMCNQVDVPLNEPLIPFHIDYTWICNPGFGCQPDWEEGFTQGNYSDANYIVFYLRNRQECNFPPAPGCSFTNAIPVEILRIQLMSYVPPDADFDRGLIKNAMRKVLSELKSKNFYRVYLLQHQCWILHSDNWPMVNSCNVPNECCWKRIRVGDSNIVEACDENIFETGECTTGCVRDVNGQSFCELLQDFQVGTPIPRIGADLEEKPLESPEGFSIQDVQPNPTYEHIKINIYSSSSRNVMIKIINIMGTNVKEIEAALSKGTNEIELSVQNLESGMYYIRVESIFDSKTSAISFIKLR
ncbi:MAG: T9SS type A sorting domain-containing protein [Candidatus Kapaibacteriota bacterium]